MTSFQTPRQWVRSTGILATTIALGLAVVMPAAADARKPIKRGDVSAAVKQVANQSAAAVESHSAAGVNLAQGEVSIDRSRTSFGNYLRYHKYRMSASFALFGTNTVNGVAGPLWCLGNVEVMRGTHGGTRVVTDLTCVD